MDSVLRRVKRKYIFLVKICIDICTFRIGARTHSVRKLTYRTRSLLILYLQNNLAFRREHIENPWPRPANPRQRGVETKAKGVLQERRGGWCSQGG